jgi:short-subunit dehydrogenase
MATQTALITGASSGIGAEFARQLAAKGYNLLLIARREERLKTLASDLMQKFPIKAEVFRADLADENDFKMLEQKIGQSAPIDLLVNNAGFATVGSFIDVDCEKHEAMVRVHIDAPVRLCRLVLPSMISRNRGAIINVASVAAFIPAPRNSVYCAAKMFLVVFTEALHEELRKTNLKIQVLCPGFTLTEFHDTPEYAGIDARSDIPGIFWLKANFLVRRSLADLERGKVLSIPGAVYKVTVALLRNPMTSYLFHFGRRIVDRGKPLR